MSRIGSTPHSSLSRRRRHSSPEETIAKFRLSSFDDSDSSNDDANDDLDSPIDSHGQPRGRPAAPKRLSDTFPQPSGSYSPLIISSRRGSKVGTQVEQQRTTLLYPSLQSVLFDTMSAGTTSNKNQRLDHGTETAVKRSVPKPVEQQPATMIYPSLQSVISDTMSAETTSVAENQLSDRRTIAATKRSIQTIDPSAGYPTSLSPTKSVSVRQDSHNNAIGFVMLVKTIFEESEQYAEFRKLLFNDVFGSADSISRANELFKNYPYLLEKYLELQAEDLIVARQAFNGAVIVRSRPIGEQKSTTLGLQFPEEKLNDAFIVVFRNKAKYKLLLEFRDEKAQNILNVLQMLLDNYQSSAPMKVDFLGALIRLSKRSGLYPQCFTLHDIKQVGLAVAAGHFGEVWKGDFRGTPVCLKIVKAYQNSHIEKLLKAFAKEAILWSQLSHPNLLPFYGIYHLDDKSRRVCLVSPWMENGNVIEYLQKFRDANRLLLLHDIANGIFYLHQQNIIHGDLKGANILVASSGRACLSDFGLSSMSDHDILRWTSLQSTTSTGGTVRWQAPELVDPEADDIHAAKESDIYAFACVCYELFTGNIPFHEILREATVTLRISRGEKPSRPNLESRDPDSVFQRGLTEKMWNLMQDCWRKEPVERPGIKQVLDRLPNTGTDPRPMQNWDEGLSSARFRREMQNSFSQLSTADIGQVIELLRDL